MTRGVRATPRRAPDSTAFICDERYFWHDTGNGALDLPTGGFIEPGTFAESPATKRRARNLLEVSGLLGALQQIPARLATREELERFHDGSYIERLRRESAKHGGDAGDGTTPFRTGSFDVAALAAGGCMTAVEAVLDGSAATAYVLCRPPGHHATPVAGAGFCLFNNAVLAALTARANGCRRIAIVDWDAHHGNGTQDAFWTDPDVLFVSVHEDRYFPPGEGLVDHMGGAGAEGRTVNVPLPGGAGDGAYALAFSRIVGPILDEFAPDLVVVSSGLDASHFDPFSHLAVTSEGFRAMARSVLQASGCGVVCCHEGGYSEGYVPFCLLAIVEELAASRTAVTDPFLPAIAYGPAADARPHEVAAVEAALQIQRPFWSALRSAR
jgi:acetoin utilization deacetylase AcuC-like enzyme